MRRKPGCAHRHRMTTTITESGTSTPLDTITAIYDAFGRNDLDALFDRIDPDVDWSLQVDAPGGELVPMLRNGRGHDTVRRYFAGVAALEFHVFEPRAFHVDGDVVLVELRLDMSHRATGKRAALDEIHHWTVRDGKVVRYRPYLDTATLIEMHRA
jgi:ketosteroid isomerase-like protein